MLTLLKSTNEEDEIILKSMPVENRNVYAKQKSGSFRLSKDFPEIKLFVLLFHYYGEPILLEIFLEG